VSKDQIGDPSTSLDRDFALAKKVGLYKGRKPSLTAEQVKEIRTRLGHVRGRLHWR
jgi:hypothetical protein